MLKLLLLLACISLGSMDRTTDPHLIVFTSEGTYYRLDPATKHAEWHKSLGGSLLSFEMDGEGSVELPKSYILPTLDGHFLFIDAKSQILIKRQQVQQLLHICLEGSLREGKLQKEVEYFLYERFEYYIINLNNGEAEDIEQFLKKGIPKTMDHFAVLKNTKKFLKQLKKDLTVAWNTISSDLELIPANAFLVNPQTVSWKDHKESEIAFRRVEAGGIQMVSGEEVFEITGKSHILSIFEYLGHGKGYLKHPLNFYGRHKLAIEHSPEGQKDQSVRDVIESDRLQADKTNSGFIHSDQVNIKKHKQEHTDTIQQCVSVFRTLRAISDESKTVRVHSGQQKHEPQEHGISYRPPQVPIVISYGPTESQPYIWVALVVMIIAVIATIGIAFFFYRLKIISLKKEISVMESKTGEQFLEVQKRLGEVQQLKKMYEVYWDKVLYQVAGDHWYEHLVFQGKFLNQPAIVYAVRLQGTDVVSLEHKLNTILNFSHRGLSKLYYYTKNTEFLLVFTEKMDPLSTKDIEDLLRNKMNPNMKKAVVKQILQAVSYLDSKIEIGYLPFEALSISYKPVSQGQYYYDFKLNSVPCLLRKPLDDSDNEQSRSCSADSETYDLRMSLVIVFHVIIHEGTPFSKEVLDQKLKNEAYSQDEYLQFFDFLIYEARSKSEKDIEGNNVSETSREMMFRDVIDHPYLWDSKRKILFLSDFSNYIETHIDEGKVKKLQSHARDYKVIKTPWIKQFHFTFMRQVSNYRKYDYESVRDLIRLIRNKLNHFHQIPKEVKLQIGKTPEGFIEYCLELFPKLLHFAYVYTRKKKWKLHMK